MARADFVEDRAGQLELQHGRALAAGPPWPLGTPLAHGAIVPAAASAYQETGGGTSPYISARRGLRFLDGRAAGGLRRAFAPERPAGIAGRGGRRRSRDGAHRPRAARSVPRRAPRHAGQAWARRPRLRSPVRPVLPRGEGPGGGTLRLAARRARGGAAHRARPGGSGETARADASLATHGRLGEGARGRARSAAPPGHPEPRLPRAAEPAAARLLRAPAAPGRGRD